ncbi:MAG: hemerythrin domain-containing protein [Phycisphaerae bacterium]
MSLVELVEYLEQRHLAMKEKLLEISLLLEEVYVRYGNKYSDVLGVLRDFFAKFKPEMESHFDKEEHILLPYIRQMDYFSSTGVGKPDFHYGGIKNPIGLMEYDHDRVESVLLEKMRAITDNYKLPSDVDDDFKQLYDGLRYIEKELREHIYLENKILFPQVIEMELRSMRSRQVPNINT